MRQRTLVRIHRIALITATRRWANASMAFLKNNEETLKLMGSPIVCGERPLTWLRADPIAPSPDILRLHMEARVLAHSFSVHGVLVGSGAAVPLVCTPARYPASEMLPYRPLWRRPRYG
jgi:hypothetical protein